MTSYNRDKPACSEVRERLSPHLDGELSRAESLVLQEHLRICAGCRQELERLEQLGFVLRTEGRRTGKQPSWESIEAFVTNRARPVSVWQDRLGFSPAMAASLAVLASIVVTATWWFGGDLPDLWKIRDQRPDQVQVLTAGLPGLDSFLSLHGAKEVSEGELINRVAFEPQLPEELPGGFRLAKIYVLFEAGVAGCCSIYQRGNECVSLFQNGPSRPPKLSVNNLESCIIAGQLCRLGGNSELQIVQIEPEGRNLTLLSRPGVIDPAEVVEALHEDDSHQSE